MEAGRAEKIFEAITSKGWNLYLRGKPGEEIPLRKTYSRGPVQALKEDILYIVLPRVQDPKNEEQISAFLAQHQTIPSIRVPSVRLSLGVKVPHLAEGDVVPFPILPGEEFQFMSIKLQEGEVELLTPFRTIMPCDVFLEALQTLQDITSLTAVAS